MTNLVSKLPQELPSHLRLKVLENQEISEKSQIWTERQPSAQYPFQKFKFGDSSQKVHTKIGIQGF